MLSGVKSLLASYTELFTQASVDSPRLSAELVLAQAMNLERAELLKQLVLNPALVPDEKAANLAERLAARRARGEPSAYLSGEKEFYGRPFLVSPDTLIPRPETELIIDLAKKFAAGRMNGFFADLGSGTGCIAITLALELPGWNGLGLELSAGAERLCRENSARLGAETSLLFERADFTSYAFAPASLDLLVSNPPYISERDYQALSREVKDYEPKNALVPGPSGLEHLRRIVEIAPAALRPGGLLLMEIGCAQGEDALDMLRRQPEFQKGSEVVKDLAGLDRVALAKKT